MKKYTPLVLLCGLLMTAEGLNAGVMAPPPDKAPRYVEPEPTCGPWFSAIKGGWFWVEDTDITISPFIGDHEIGFDTGWGISIVPLGSRVSDMLSLSLSTGYYETDVETVTLPFGGGSFAANGDLEVIPIYANAVFNFPIVGALSGYVGGGVGAVHTDLDGTIPALAVAFGQDDWDFGVQGMAGLAYEIVECVKLTAGYRYQHIFADNDDIQAHSAEFGVVVTW